VWFSVQNRAQSPSALLSVTLKQYWKQDASAGNPPTLISGSNPLTATAGRTLIAMWSGADNASVVAPTDNAGTFTIPTNARQDALGSNQITAGIAHQLNVAGGSHTITPQVIAIGGAGEVILRIFEVTGLSTAPTVRTVGFETQINTSASWTVGSGVSPNTPQAGDVAFAIVTYENTAVLASASLTDPPTGWNSLGANQDATNNLPTQMSYKLVANAGAVSASWSTVDTHVSEHVVIIVVLAP